MRICVPSGVGDISWLISKIINSKEWKNGELEIAVADGWPFRADDYLKLVGAKFAQTETPPYGAFNYEDILGFEKMNPYKIWSDVANSGFSAYFMQPNQHLERGLPLKDYLPDLETDYHYPMEIPDIKYSKFYPELLNYDNWVGISAASYRGAKAWKTWSSTEWVELCEKIIDDGYNICLMGGKWDDLTDMVGDYLPEDRVLNLVGRTTFGEACAVHKMIDFYIGFSSGLGIIRTVLDLPTMMLWPGFQQPLSTSWADPEDLESKKYMAMPYVSSNDIYLKFKKQANLFT